MDIRKDFPVLHNHPDMIYLDNAATVQKPQYVIDEVSEYMQHEYANIHRGQYTLAELSEKHYYTVRKQVAQLLHCKDKEVFFSYNATYCSNIVAQSLCYSGIVSKGDVVVLGIRNHHASIVVWQQLQKIFGFEIVFLDIQANSFGVDFTRVHDIDKNRIKVVDVCHVSNVTGVIYDIVAIRAFFGAKVCLIVDASQSVPNISVNVSDLSCDILYFTGHKCMAYPGVGVCFVATQRIDRMEPMLVGGAIIEDVNRQGHTLIHGIEKLTPGTPNLSSIVSLGAALRYFDRVGGYSVWRKYEEELIYYMLDGLHSVSTVHLIGSAKVEGRIGIFSLATDTHPIDIAEALADKNICIRSGGHCAHPLLYALGQKGLVRASIYLYTSKSDIDTFLHELNNII